jgi:parallel beta-helix repeat protein
VRGKVENLTATTNCVSGIFVDAVSSAVRVEANVSVRNGNTNQRLGGITILGSDNLVRWNETGGNGYVSPSDDYGIGIIGNNNVIEENTAIGNTNGIILFPSSTGNKVRSNVAVGNAPIQVSVGQPAITGVDIWDQSD